MFEHSVCFQIIQHNIVMITGFEVIKHMFHFAISINQETDAVDTIIGFAHEFLFAPDAELLAHLMVFI